MVLLVVAAQSLEDCYRILHAWLLNEHCLEATLQCAVFLDMLAIFLQRRRTDEVQLTSG